MRPIATPFLRGYLSLPELWLAVMLWLVLTALEALPLFGRWDVVTQQTPALSTPYLATIAALGAAVGIAKVGRSHQMARIPASSPSWKQLIAPLALPIAAFGALPLALPHTMQWLNADHADHGHSVAIWSTPDVGLLAALCLCSFAFAALWLRGLPLHRRWGSFAVTLIAWLASPLATAFQLTIVGALLLSSAAFWPSRSSSSRSLVE